MDNILMSLLSKEKPTSVAAKRITRYGELHCVEVRYLKDKKWRSAESFYTSSWVSDSPTGPRVSPDGFAHIESIDDIALVTEFKSLEECKAKPWRTEANLKCIVEAMDSAASEAFLSQYPYLKGIASKVTLRLSPMPALIVVLTEGCPIKNFIGTLVVSLGGEVEVAVKASRELEVILAKMQSEPVSRGLLEGSVCDGTAG